MNVENIIASICEVIKQGKVALFIGSGVSIDPPSRLPAGKPLKETPVKGLIARHPPNEEKLVLENVIANLSLEAVYGIIHEEIGDQLITAMKMALDDERLEPNKIHRFVAKALSLGNVIVTTNYDTLIERAYSQEKDLEICYDEETFKGFINNFKEGEGRWLLKLHGSFRVRKKDTSKSIVTTLDRIGRGLPPKTEEALRLILKRLPLIFWGYGCGDLDIVYPVLAQQESEKEIYWIKHQRERAEKPLYVGDEIEELKSELPHIATVLMNRRKHNDGKIYLIKHLTSDFVERLIEKLNWELAEVERENKGLSESQWKGELFCLGYRASQLEKASILAKLIELGRNTERGREKLSELNKLMQKLYKEALKESEKEEFKDPLKTSRLYRDFGFSLYLRDHEEAIRHYEESEKLLNQVTTEVRETEFLEKAELFSCFSLAYRRAYQIEKAREYALRAWKAIPEEIRKQLNIPHGNFTSIKYKDRELGDKQKSDLGNILRRLANMYHDLVSDPATLSIAIRPGRDIWKMDNVEKKLLEEALQLARIDKELQKSAGNVRGRIQSENVLGLIATKLGEADMEVHQQSKNDASLLGWTTWEYAQACRNLGLALEKEGKLEQAVDTLKEAKRNFRRKDDVITTDWHIGRILIKKGDARGIFIIEEITKGDRDWHWKGNDLALLGIGYCDLLKNREKEAIEFFKQMLELYKGKKDEVIKSRAYGIDNALANVKSALLRFCTKETHKQDDFCKELQHQQIRLEKMREEALKTMIGFFSKS